MHLHFLALSNFRIYKEAVFEFSKGVNGIIGDNALGKTTILEAIYLAMFGRSFRTQEIKDLIREGTDSFAIELGFTKNEIEQKIRIVQSREERRITYNSSPFSNYSGLLGVLQGVLFAPHDLDLIKGPPLARRSFLDMQLAQVDPLYVHHLKRYSRAMKQRNFLLKSRQFSAIEPFESEMAISAAYIVKQRAKNIAQLNLACQPLFNSISAEKENLELSYKTQGPFEKDFQEIEHYFRKQYHTLRPKEIILGSTLSGPHKDNITILINGKEARTFASEGQKHSLVASLKLAEWHLIKERAGDAPLMMVDDLLLSLDERRQEKLCVELEKSGQTYFSTTHKPHSKFVKEVNWILLKAS